jgi:hypothetical protein
MPAHPPSSGTVYQPRFRKDASVKTLTLHQPSSTDPSDLAESTLPTSPQINWTGLEKRYLCVIENDFTRKAGAALDLPWTYAEVGTNAAGTHVTAGFGGEYTLTHSGDSEAQMMKVDFDDHLPIDIQRPCFFETRLKINFAGAAFSADQRFVAGFAAAYNATLDSTVTNCWFRIEGASLNILIESDDGTTDTDDVDSGVDIVDNTYIVLRIEVVNEIPIFYVNGATVTQTGATLAALAAATGVQPIVCIQRDAGTEAEVVTIDYIRCGYLRA